MRLLVWFVLMAVTGLAAACADDKNSPFTFKDFPGYMPAGGGAPYDPRRTPAGFVP